MADAGGEPPFELWLAWMCERWGMSPNEVLATPAGLLDRMTAAVEAWRAVAQFEQIPAGRGAAWVEANPGYWDWVTRYKGWID